MDGYMNNWSQGDNFLRIGKYFVVCLIKITPKSAMRDECKKVGSAGWAGWEAKQALQPLDNTRGVKQITFSLILSNSSHHFNDWSANFRHSGWYDEYSPSSLQQRNVKGLFHMFFHEFIQPLGSTILIITSSFWLAHLIKIQPGPLYLGPKIWLKIN